jgi:hypothetical protein
MPNTVRKHAEQYRAHAVAARSRAAVAQGGPVAALQQSIQDRIGTRDLATAVLPASPETAADRLAAALSRAVGRAALAAAFGGVALVCLR